MQEGPGKYPALEAIGATETEDIQEEASIGAASEDPAKAEKGESVENAQKDLGALEKEGQEAMEALADPGGHRAGQAGPGAGIRNARSLSLIFSFFLGLQ